MASVIADVGGEEEETDLDLAVEDAPIVRLVNAIMTQAVGDRASDVHIEPREHDVRIRFRVDGVLMEPMPPAPKNIQNGLISRMKVMADLNIERDAAQRRLGDVVAALETIRLNLLKLHAGAASVQTLTTDLGLAREVSAEIDRLLAGQREVDEAIGPTTDRPSA